MQAEATWTLSIVAACVAVVIFLVVRERGATRPASPHECPQCQHEYSEPETGNTLVRQAVRLPARPARCKDLSREWEATALGSKECNCEHPFHTSPASDWFGLTA